MITVLNIITDTNIGGAGRCLVNYLKYCDRKTYCPKVVVPRGSALIPLITPLAEVIEADDIADRSFSAAGVKSLRRIIREVKPDIVHTHGSFSGRIAAKQCGRKIIYTRHCAFPVPGYLKYGPGHLVNGAVNSFLSDRIIAVSPATEENLLDSGVPGRKITVMMNGVEPVERLNPEACAEVRTKYGIREGVFTAGILARLESYKGHVTLLEAAKQLRDAGREFQILIAGEGSEERNIRDKIKAYNLEDCVRMLGFVENPAEMLSILDVQLNCSYGTEASSLSILEGMSMGVPAILSDYGGNPYLAEDGASGLFFRTEDSTELAERIAAVMDNPELLIKLGRNALETYHTRFTGEIFAKHVEAVYQLAIQKK